MRETINEVITSLNAISNAVNMMKVSEKENWQVALAIIATLEDNVKKLSSITDETGEDVEEEV